MLGQLKDLWKRVRSGAVWRLETLWHAFKWFFKAGPTRLLFGVGILAAFYLAYRLPADFLDQSWPYFNVPRRLLSWILRGTAVRSILGVLSLLVLYSLIYLFRIWKRRFIVISGFRVWGELAQKFPEKGVEARLRDELMHLWGDMRALGAKERWVKNRPGADSNGERDSFEGGTVELEDGVLSLPETHVTLQYEGISLEGMNTFVRRFAGLEVVITGDLISHLSELVLVARAANYGPWEVVIKKYDKAVFRETDLKIEMNVINVIEPEHWEMLVNRPDSDTLKLGLQWLAFLIMTGMANRFQPKPERAFALLQLKARKLGEYDLAIHLATLGWQAARDAERNVDKAKRNLATAYNDKGSALGNKEKFIESLPSFLHALEWDPEFELAYNNLKLAAGAVEDKEIADKALEEAEEIRRSRSQPHA